MSGYMARNPLMPPEAPSWLPPEDAAVLERLRSPAALNPLLGPDPYGGAAIGTSSTRPQAQAVDANGQPFDPVVGRGLPVTRGQLAGIAESAWQTAGAVSDGGIGTAGGAVGAIKAYHGSPHSFDRFDMSKIGTGEGAQAYGHGLYFAGNEGVARSYRDALSGHQPNPDHARALMEQHAVQADMNRLHSIMTDESIARGAKTTDAAWGDIAVEPLPEIVAKYQKQWDALVARATAAHEQVQSLAPTIHRPGKMYEVNLDVEPHQLLDWDKPVAGQTPEVAAKLVDAGLTPRFFPSRSGSDAYDLLTGTHGGRPEAAASLRDAGIPGIKYLDAGSRSAGTGTSNFVMFDDGLIQILRKYGLPGVVTGGAAAAAAPGQGDTP